MSGAYRPWALLLFLGLALCFALAVVSVSLPRYGFACAMAVVGWVGTAIQRRVPPEVDCLAMMSCVPFVAMIGVPPIVASVLAGYPLGAAFADPFGFYDTPSPC